MRSRDIRSHPKLVRVVEQNGHWNRQADVRVQISKKRVENSFKAVKLVVRPLKLSFACFRDTSFVEKWLRSGLRTESRGEEMKRNRSVSPGAMSCSRNWIK